MIQWEPWCRDGEDTPHALFANPTKTCGMRLMNLFTSGPKEPGYVPPSCDLVIWLDDSEAGIHLEITRRYANKEPGHITDPVVQAWAESETRKVLAWLSGNADDAAKAIE